MAEDEPRLTGAQLRVLKKDLDDSIMGCERMLERSIRIVWHPRVYGDAINYRLGALSAIDAIFNGQSGSSVFEGARQKINDLHELDRTHGGGRDHAGRSGMDRKDLRIFWIGVAAGIRVAEGTLKRDELFIIPHNGLDTRGNPYWPSSAEARFFDRRIKISA